MNVIELRDRDPKRFEEEYYKWHEYALDYEWWDYLYSNFKADCNAVGVVVYDIQFNLGYSQSDYAAFTGRAYVHDWMEAQGHDKTHLAAYLACWNDGSYVRLETGRGGSMRANLEECVNQTAPSGVFAGLDQEAWVDLVDEQIGWLNVESEVLSFCEDLAHTLYRKLRDEYEHLTSKSMFIEHCECNEVTFEETEDALQTD
jgi:hypothetical protein